MTTRRGPLRTTTRSGTLLDHVLVRMLRRLAASLLLRRGGRRRSYSSSPPWSATAREMIARLGPTPVIGLIAMNCIATGAYYAYAPESAAARRFCDEWMTLSSRRFRRRPAVLLTHAFMHQDPIHLAFNMLSLHSFGGITCAMLGPTRFLALFMTSAVAGGAAHIAYSRVMPALRFPASRIVRTDDAAVGASAGIAGCVMYYAVRVPRGEVTVFILPVPNPIFVVAFVGISAYFALFSETKGHWAHAGHLGGAAVGITYAAFRSLRRL